MRLLKIVLAMVFIAFSFATSPALAYGDCAAGTGRSFLAIIKGAGTAGTLVMEREKSGSDIYMLLADVQRGLSPVAKLSTITAALAVMNCQALEAANPSAGTLRLRWAEALDIPVRALTADRVQAAFTRRLKASGKGQNQLLTEAERQLLADTLSAACTWEGALCTSTKDLAAKLDLPKPSLGS